MLDNVDWTLGVSGMNGRDGGDVLMVDRAQIIGRGGYERNMHGLHLDPSYGRFGASCTAASGFHPNNDE